MNLQEIKTIILEKYPNSNSAFLTKYLEICSKPEISTEIYTENHHILPQSIWPEYKCFTDNSWNKIKLSAYNHILAHWYFSMATGKLWGAVNAFAIQYTEKELSNLTETELHEIANIFQYGKSQFAVNQSERMKGCKNPMFGKPGTFLGKIHSDKTKEQIKISSIGKTHSDKTKAIISNKLKGSNNPMFGKTGKSSPRFGKPSSRRGEHWIYENELYDLWIANGKLKHVNFRKLAIQHNYPDVRYERMISNFTKR